MTTGMGLSAISLSLWAGKVVLQALCAGSVSLLVCRRVMPSRLRYIGLTMPANLDRFSDESNDFIDLFENGALGLHFVGPDGVILNANQAELDLLGYTRGEYIGHHISEFHVDAAVIEDILKRLNQKEILKNYEARLRAKDGSIKHVLITSNVRWKQNDFIHTRCFTRDITDRKKVEEERERLIAELERTRETLEDKIQELEDFHDAVVNRELKMIELEKEVKLLRADNRRLAEDLQQARKLHA